MGLEKINDYKKIRNLTNKDISDITGISISSLDKITSGSNTNPKLETVKLICGALDCKLSDLLDDGNDTDELTLQEQNHIKKYRALDEHGKKIVDFVLDEEYKHSSEEQESGEVIHTKIFRAAKSTDNHLPEITTTDKDFSKIPPTDIKL